MTDQTTTPLADALAGVDATMGTEGNPYGDPARELAALRDLAEAVREYLPAVDAETELSEAARAALPALVLLGDFIGNTFEGKVGIPAFDRCAVILALKQALGQLPGLPEKAEPEKVYGGYTHEQLTEAFALVKNRENWKLPIAATVPADADRACISAAVVFFTGSQAEFIPGRRGLHVGAAGYYAAIGS